MDKPRPDVFDSASTDLPQYRGKLYLMVTTVDDTHFVKIGISQDPVARRRQIQSGSVMMPPGWFRHPIRLLATSVGEATVGDERHLHQIHHLWRVAGEWFQGSQQLITSVMSYGEWQEHAA